MCHRAATAQPQRVKTFAFVPYILNRFLCKTSAASAFAYVLKDVWLCVQPGMGISKMVALRVSSHAHVGCGPVWCEHSGQILWGKRWGTVSPFSFSADCFSAKSLKMI